MRKLATEPEASSSAANSRSPERATNEGFVVVAEVNYPYVPITGFMLQETVNLGHVEYFLPRLPGTIPYDPDE